MRQEILGLLRCPVSGLPLVLEARETSDGHVMEGTLRTTDRRFEYPILEGVPVLLPSPATGRRTRSVFNLQWSRRFAGLEPPHVLYGFSLDAGTEFIEQSVLRPEIRKDRWVLDAGCGTAERSAALARRGHRVVAFDLSDSVRTAFKRFRDIPDLHLLQADVLNPPVAPDTMDSVICVGVLHHTPDARRGFHALAGLQRPGGSLLIWVYPADRGSTDPFLGKLYLVRDHLSVTGKLPPTLIWGLSKVTTALLYPFFAGKFRRQRNDREVRRRDLWGAILMNTYDFLSPPYQSRHSPEEVARWYQDEGYGLPEKAGTGFYFSRKMLPPSARPPVSIPRSSEGTSGFDAQRRRAKARKDAECPQHPFPRVSVGTRETPT